MLKRAVVMPQVVDHPFPRVTSRLLLGALAGIVGTAAMTAAMNRMYQRLPKDERYPLPPREITQTLLGGTSEDSMQDRSTAAHFSFGAAAGALMGTVSPSARPVAGAIAGLCIWTASYFGWVPALGVLNSAEKHPIRRNALMIGAHLVWGSVTTATMRDLLAARHTMLGDGPLRDRNRQA